MSNDMKLHYYTGKLIVKVDLLVNTIRKMNILLRLANSFQKLFNNEFKQIIHSTFLNSHLKLVTNIMLIIINAFILLLNVYWKVFKIYCWSFSFSNNNVKGDVWILFNRLLFLHIYLKLLKHKSIYSAWISMQEF